MYSVEHMIGTCFISSQFNHANSSMNPIDHHSFCLYFCEHFTEYQHCSDAAADKGQVRRNYSKMSHLVVQLVGICGVYHNHLVSASLVKPGKNKWNCSSIIHCHIQNEVPTRAVRSPGYASLHVTE